MSFQCFFANEAEEQDLPRRVSPGTRKTLESAGRMFKWVTRDKRRLEQLAESLKAYNNNLDHLASSVEQASMRRSLRTAFVAPNELGHLRLLQECAGIVGHDDLRIAASAKAFVKEVYQEDDVLASLQSTTLENVNATGPRNSGTFDDWKLDYDRLQFEGVAIFDQSRTTSVYTYGDGRKEDLMADWTRCRDDSWRKENPKAFHTRVVNLVKVLNRDLLPKGFSVLRCIGYVNASSTAIGYLFRIPEHAVPGKDPISLYQILNDTQTRADIPVLGDRFHLARAIATTVFEFHNIGWMHKNLHPHNVLFWPSKDCNGEVDLRKPYLVGFDLSRSNQPDEISEKPLAAEEDDLYRHPSYKGENTTGFKPSYDYFSLGVLLFEIAMWRLVSKAQSSRSSANQSEKTRRNFSITDPEFINKTVMGSAKDLGRFVGARYRDAILACVSLQFDEVWEMAENNGQDLRLQQAVQRRVVDAIDSCQA